MGGAAAGEWGREEERRERGGSGFNGRISRVGSASGGGSWLRGCLAGKVGSNWPCSRNALLFRNQDARWSAKLSAYVDSDTAQFGLRVIRIYEINNIKRSTLDSLFSQKKH